MKVKGIKFQHSFFRPCIALFYWIHWGNLVFDTRPVRKYLRLPDEDDTRLEFASRVKELTDKIGCEDFRRMLYDLQYADDHREREIIKQNHENGINDDLPF